MGKSYSYSVTKDMRSAIDGDVGQFTSPQSQIANPFGLNIGASESMQTGNIAISYGDVKYNDLDAVNELVTSIMQQNKETMSAVNRLGTDVLNTVAAAATEIKEPMTRYIPIVGGAVILYLLLKFGKG